MKWRLGPSDDTERNNCKSISHFRASSYGSLYNYICFHYKIIIFFPKRKLFLEETGPMQFKLHKKMFSLFFFNLCLLKQILSVFFYLPNHIDINVIVKFSNIVDGKKIFIHDSLWFKKVWKMQASGYYFLVHWINLKVSKCF